MVKKKISRVIGAVCIVDRAAGKGRVRFGGSARPIRGAVDAIGDVRPRGRGRTSVGDDGSAEAIGGASRRGSLTNLTDPDATAGNASSLTIKDLA